MPQRWDLGMLCKCRRLLMCKRVCVCQGKSVSASACVRERGLEAGGVGPARSSSWRKPPFLSHSFFHPVMWGCLINHQALFLPQMCLLVFSTGKIRCLSFQFSSVQFNCSVMSDSLRPHELQHARPPCPSPTPGVYSNSCPLSQ